jgi:spore maturation protein CgeB
LLDSSDLYPANPLFAESLPDLAQDRTLQYSIYDEGPLRKKLLKSKVLRAIYKLSGHRSLTAIPLNREFLEMARRFKPDVALITKGGYVYPSTLRFLKQSFGTFLINYNTDDPFNPDVTSPYLKKSIPLFDLYACTKKAVIDDIKKAGGERVAYVPFGYKPNHQFPEQSRTAEEKVRFSSDVVFIGGCDADRVPIISTIPLAKKDLRLVLYGWFWNRHLSTRPYFRGLALGRDFRLAISGAKIVLNLVRRANRDGHGPRTFEIPACGGFMLTDRTEEQMAFLEEDKEAVYFSSNDEMLDKIRFYLAHDSERERIAAAGRRRITSDPNTFRDRLESMLDMVNSFAGRTPDRSADRQHLHVG